jgi:hypothetical protein
VSKLERLRAAVGPGTVDRDDQVRAVLRLLRTAPGSRKHPRRDGREVVRR